MSKLTVEEAVVSGESNEEWLAPLNVFDMSTLHSTLPSVGIDLTDKMLASLLSESGSITPTTIKAEIGVDFDNLNKALAVIHDQQQQKIVKKINALSNERSEALAAYKVLEKESTEYELARIGDDINQARTNAEIGAKNGEIREARKELDQLVENYRALDGTFTTLNNTIENIDKELVMLRTYQQNAGAEGSHRYTEVKRFALVSENLRGLEDAPFKADILHPLELVLMREALDELQKSGDRPYGVVCDIFVRVDNKISIATDTIGALPETHCVALWKENGQLRLIDPSNSSFSSELIDEIQELCKYTVIQGVQGVLYGNGKKPTGRVDGTSRDCIDIAIKIILELTDQFLMDSKKPIAQRLQATFAQLSTENLYTKHFVKTSDRQLRELTTTSSDIRHLAFKVANAI